MFFRLTSMITLFCEGDNEMSIEQRAAKNIKRDYDTSHKLILFYI